MTRQVGTSPPSSKVVTGSGTLRQIGCEISKIALKNVAHERDLGLCHRQIRFSCGDVTLYLIIFCFAFFSLLKFLWEGGGDTLMTDLLAQAVQVKEGAECLVSEQEDPTILMARAIEPPRVFFITFQK